MGWATWTGVNIQCNHQVVVDAIDKTEQTAHVSDQDYVIIKRLGQALAAFGENFLLHKSVTAAVPKFARYDYIPAYL